MKASEYQIPLQVIPGLEGLSRFKSASSKPGLFVVHIFCFDLLNDQLRVINLIDENGDISRKLYGSYCLIQFPEESCDSFKLYMADQSFCA